LRVVFITKIRSTRWCKEPICCRRAGRSDEAEDPVLAACVEAVHFCGRRWRVIDFTSGIVCALTYNTVGDCTASNSPGRRRRVISDRTPRPPRRAQIGVPHVSGVRRGEHGVPATRAAAPSTPGCGTLPTDCHARSQRSQYPLASTVAAHTASRDRHAQSPPPTSAVALVPSPCLHRNSFSSTIHLSIPS